MQIMKQILKQIKYVGPKFTFRRVRKEIPKEEKIMKLQAWCQLFHNYEFAPSYKGGSHGNLSFRKYKNEVPFIITCAKTSLDKITNKNFATVIACDFNKLKIYGHTRKRKQPSSESMLHFAIYQNRPDVNAIFHGHYEIPDEHIEKLGIPVVREIDYGTIELVDEVLKKLENHKIIKLEGHGFLSLGESIEEAGKLILDIYEKRM